MRARNYSLRNTAEATILEGLPVCDLKAVGMIV